MLLHFAGSSACQAVARGIRFVSHLFACYVSQKKTLTPCALNLHSSGHQRAEIAVRSWAKFTGNFKLENSHCLEAYLAVRCTRSSCRNFQGLLRLVEAPVPGLAPFASVQKEHLFSSAPLHLWPDPDCTMCRLESPPQHSRVSPPAQLSLHCCTALCSVHVSKQLMAQCSEMASCFKLLAIARLGATGCSVASGLYAWSRSFPDNHLLVGALLL